MGLLIDGEWHDTWYDTKASGGRFVRQSSAFRRQVRASIPAQTPETSDELPFEPGRYHLYVSYACPWAHRTLIVRELKRLTEVVSVSAVHWLMGEQGWVFTPELPDHVEGVSRLYQLYQLSDARYTGRVTVPVLWDKQERRVVNNESSEIIRMLNSEFSGDPSVDIYPEHLRKEIDEVNAWVYPQVNNGVYRAGFATTQEAYEEAVTELFEALDRLEELTASGSYLVGGQLTEADVRLFTTLVRFDAVYVGHFKCNLRRLVDYPNLWAYTRRILALPGVAQTVRLSHIKNHYYQSHPTINPSRVVPRGPLIDFGVPLGG
ncbi:MAG: glutathione S-transferase family protein [Polyangiaceae bacterium]|nr:glutathione S-transferase family protein [Polyangiaceae bacterium]MCW5792127.1 glutathione S-transferase family protein [Polyangiaceae bacterium]